MEIDHIDQAADDGGNNRENAIPVCFDCHAEIHSYNPRHPKGRKFTAEETRDMDVGPLQALLNELEFNAVVSSKVTQQERGCLFKDQQFDRAIRQGSIGVLDEALKRVVLEAYAAIGRANGLLAVEWQQAPGMVLTGQVADEAQRAVRAAGPKIAEALSQLAAYMDFDVRQ